MQRTSARSTAGGARTHEVAAAAHTRAHAASRRSALFRDSQRQVLESLHRCCGGLLFWLFCSATPTDHHQAKLFLRESARTACCLGRQRRRAHARRPPSKLGKPPLHPSRARPHHHARARHTHSDAAAAAACRRRQAGGHHRDGASRITKIREPDHSPGICDPGMTPHSEPYVK